MRRWLMTRAFRTPVQRYGVALALTAAAIGVRAVLDGPLRQTSALLFFIPVVMVAAWWGGLGPGLLATALTATAANFLFLGEPLQFAITGPELHKTLLFLLVGAQVSWLSGALRDETLRAEEANLDLERRVRERTRQLQVQTSVLEAQSEASDDGIMVASADGTVLRVNGQLAALWGTGPVPPGTPLAAVAARLDAAVASPGDVLGDAPTELALHDGRTIDRYSAPIHGGGDDGAAPYGRVWYFRDVTERKRLEREVMDVCEREQRRIGQDLHDGLGPHLVGVSLMAQALEADLAAAAPQHVESTRRIGQLIDDAIAQARGLARGLRPVALEEDGLATALQELALNASRMYAVPCTFTAAGDAEPADVGTATHLYRITQEAVNNAVRHGRAKRVDVRLADVDQGAVRLSITDDGVGFDGAPPAGSRGMGVHTMTYRARVIGGSIRIARAGAADGPRPGTVVEVTLPRKAVTDAAPGADATSDPDPVSPRDRRSARFVAAE